MATLTLNAAVGSGRKVTVSAGTGGSLTGSVALLIDNTANKDTVLEGIKAVVKAYRRRASKASKVSSISTSGSTLE